MVLRFCDLFKEITRMYEMYFIKCHYFKIRGLNLKRQQLICLYHSLFFLKKEKRKYHQGSTKWCELGHLRSTAFISTRLPGGDLGIILI